MAGSHQLWLLDLNSGNIAPFLGSGREELVNGSDPYAALNQPSGLASNEDSTRLYFADSEASAIRYATLDYPPEARTIVGTGLFDFGDVDGVAEEARLQHPLGVAWHDGLVYVADTYNSKLKTVNPESREAKSLLGSEAGWRDGSDPLFYEPSGLDIANGLLYVADTNNHSIRVVDLDTLETSTLVLKGMERFMAGAGEDNFRGEVLTLEPVEIGAGAGQLLLDVRLPEGYKLNELAPSQMAWRSEGETVTFAPDASRSLVAPEFPVAVDGSFRKGESTVTGDLTLYYCEEETVFLCLVQQVRLVVPLRVVEGGEAAVMVEYDVPAIPTGD
jgi:hypothetical protein